MFALPRFRLTVSPAPPTTLPEPPTEIDVPVSVVVATVEWNPFEPMKARPEVKFEKKTELLNVDDAVENIPLEKPMVVPVAL